MKISSVALASLVPLTLAACADSARVYPMNDAALHTGVPKVAFVRQGLGHGPVTVTMPDGEVLNGEYQVTDGSTAVLGTVGRQTVSAFGFGGAQPVAISATGTRGTLMNCEGSVDMGGSGAGICETNKGARYRLMF